MHIAPSVRGWYVFERYRLRIVLAILFSLLVHGLVLSLEFGLPGLGLPGLQAFWDERRAHSTGLRLELADADKEKSQAANTSVMTGAKEGPLEPPAAEAFSPPLALMPPPPLDQTRGRPASALAIYPSDAFNPPPAAGLPEPGTPAGTATVHPKPAQAIKRMSKPKQRKRLNARAQPKTSAPVKQETAGSPVIALAEAQNEVFTLPVQPVSEPKPQPDLMTAVEEQASEADSSSAPAALASTMVEEAPPASLQHEIEQAKDQETLEQAQQVAALAQEEEQSRQEAAALQAQRMAEEERRAEEAAAQKLAEDAQRQAQERLAQLQAEEAAREHARQQEQEALRQAEELSQQRLARQREEEALRLAQQQARGQAEEEARQQAIELEAKKQAELIAQQRLAQQLQEEEIRRAQQLAALQQEEENKMKAQALEAQKQAEQLAHAQAAQKAQEELIQQARQARQVDISRLAQAQASATPAPLHQESDQDKGRHAPAAPAQAGPASGADNAGGVSLQSSAMGKGAGTSGSTAADAAPQAALTSSPKAAASKESERKQPEDSESGPILLTDEQLDAHKAIQVRKIDKTRLDTLAVQELEHAKQAPRRRTIFGRADDDIVLKMYIEEWAQQVERHSEASYRPPSKRLARHPVVTVAVRSDGTVEKVSLNQVSEHKDIDEAVQRLLQLVTHKAFPLDLARRYDVIEIQRLWEFTERLRLLEPVR